MIHDLYRHFDKDGRLLYVGISFSAFNRLQSHRQYSGWYDQVTTITIEKCSSRAAAMYAEAAAIRNEKPLHNQMCKMHERNGQMWLRVSDVAEILNVSRNTVYKRIERGELPKSFRDFKPPRWLREEFFTWLNAQTADPVGG